jgi:thioredoxin-related protein
MAFSKLKTAIVVLLTVTASPLKAQVEPFEVAQQKSIESKKPMMIFFLGNGWCYWCDEMKMHILSNEEFKKAVEKDFDVIWLNFSRNISKKSVEGSYLERFGISKFPSVVVFDPVTENVFTESGYRKMEPKKYAKWLKKNFYYKDAREPLMGYGNFTALGAPTALPKADPVEPDVVAESGFQFISQTDQPVESQKLAMHFGGGWLRRLKKAID